MGYMDSLYRPEHILGYTGDINNNPTVYFFAPSPGKNGLPKTTRVNNSQKVLFLSGHITQAHSDANNVGRDQVIESWSYSLMNAGSQHDSSGLIKQGQTALQEVFHPSETTDTYEYFPTPDGFDDFHISRSTFTSVSFKDVNTIKVLAKAIANNPLIKKMYGVVADDKIFHRRSIRVELYILHP